MDDRGCTKIQELADAKADDEGRVCSNCPFSHMTTLHCAERTRKTLGNWAKHHSKL